MSPAFYKSNFVVQEKLIKNEIMNMEKQNKHKAIYWLIFIASNSLFAYALYIHWAFLPLILPFIVTSFAKGMDII